MSEVVRKVVGALAAGDGVPVADLEDAFRAILAGESTDILNSAFLMGLRVRGETVDDIVAGVRIMREHVAAVTAPADVVDTCGTGGLSWTSLNTSTAAAIVAAGAGAVVAKHGNRSAPPKTGSADVLEALGVNLTPTPEQAEKCFRDAGVLFMFAQAHHGAVRHVGPVRKALGIRTIFNLLGPLSNPAGARRQLLGVFSEDWVKPMAEALLALGAERAWVVHGVGGIDEISTFGPTRVAEVSNGQLRTFDVSLDDLGVQKASIEELRGGDAVHNREALLNVLNGQPGAFSDLVAVNAAGTLVVAGLASDLREGVEMARNSILDGRALQCLQALKRASNE